MRNLVYRFLEYCDNNAWPGQSMYWGGYILLMVSVYRLETLLFAGALFGGLIMHWGGLVTGGRMAREALEYRP